MTKICSKCGVEKAFSEFAKHKNGKNGLRSTCRSCESLYKREYRKNEDNKRKEAEYHRQYCQNNKEKRATKDRRYRENNKEKIRERRRQYRENNKEKIAARLSQWYENNKKEILARRQRRLENLPAGIYKITNKQTGVIYIGCSTALPRRFKEHKRRLKKNKHRNKLLQEAYNQCGLDAFEFEVIKEYPADTPFEVLRQEEERTIWEAVINGKKVYNEKIKNLQHLY